MASKGPKKCVRGKNGAALPEKRWMSCLKVFTTFTSYSSPSTIFIISIIVLTSNDGIHPEFPPMMKMM